MNRQITAVLLFASTLLASAAQAERIPVDNIVAVVNNDIIMASELNEKTLSLAKNLASQGQKLPSRQAFEKQVLDHLIMQNIQLQLAQRSGLKIDDQALNSAVRSIASQNNMTLDEMRVMVETEGQSFKLFREELRKEITLRQLRTRHVDNRIRITEREIDQFLKNDLNSGARANTEFHLAHILIAVPEAASPDQIGSAREKATELVNRLRHGADFAQTAIAESDGQQALNGGDLGPRKLGQLPTMFTTAVTELQVGDISDPVQSASGFHVIKLIGGGMPEEQHVVSQTLVRHILIRTDDLNSSASVQSQLSILRERLVGGDDFATLAKSHSQDRASAIQGGDLGWSNPGDFVNIFETTISKLDIDEISEPFESEYGWHILQVQGRRNHDSTEEFKRAEAKKLLRERKTGEELQLWLRRLRDESFIEYRNKS